MITLLEPQASYEAGRGSILNEPPVAPVCEESLNWATFKLGQFHGLSEFIERKKKEAKP